MYLFIIVIGTHYLLTILAVKFEIVHYITWMCVCDTAVCKAGGVDLDRKLPFAASHLGLHRLQRSIRGIMDLFIRCASIILSILNSPFFDRPEISLPVVVSKTDG